MDIIGRFHLFAASPVGHRDFDRSRHGPIALPRGAGADHADQVARVCAGDVSPRATAAFREDVRTLDDAIPHAHVRAADVSEIARASNCELGGT